MKIHEWVVDSEAGIGRSVTDPFRRGRTLHSDPIPFIGPGAACIGQAMLGPPETIEFVEISHIELVTRR